MICPKCGHQVFNHSDFCAHCGAKLNTQSVLVGTDEIVMQPSEPSAVKSKKRGVHKPNNKKVAACIAIPLAIVVLAGILVTVFFSNIQRSIMGESVYYFYKESQTISSLLSADVIADLRHPNSYTAQSVASATVSADNSVNTILKPLRAVADVSYDKSTGKVLSSAKLQDDGDTILSANGNYIDGAFEIESSVMDESLVLTNPFSQVVAGSQKAAEQITDDAENYGDILTALQSVDKTALLNVLKTVCTFSMDLHVQRSKDEWNGQKCSTVSFPFTGEELDSMLISLLTAMHEDPSLSESFEPLVERIAASIGETSGNDIYTFLQQYISENSVFENMTDIVTYTVYYDKHSNIVNREAVVSFDDIAINIGLATSWEDGEVKSLDFSYTPGAENTNNILHVWMNKSVSNGKMDIDLTVEAPNEEVCTLRISDMCAQSCSGVHVLAGTCDFSIHDETQDLLSLQVNAGVNDTGYVIWVDGALYSEPCFTGTITTTLSPEASCENAKLPDTYETDAEDYFVELYNNASDTFFQYLNNKYFFKQAE